MNPNSTFEEMNSMTNHQSDRYETLARLDELRRAIDAIESPARQRRKAQKQAKTSRRAQRRDLQTLRQKLKQREKELRETLTQPTL